MRRKPAMGALLFVAAISLAVSELLGPFWSLAALVTGIGAGWLLVPGLWRSSLAGAIGGSDCRFARPRPRFPDCDEGGGDHRPGQVP